MDRKFMKPVKYFLLAVLTLSSIGCTIMDGNAIVTGVVRAPVSPQEVRLYRKAPEKPFEEIALVSSSAGHDFQKGSDLMNAAIERIKQEAAQVGANGVILTVIKERDAPSVTTSYGNVYASGTGGTATFTGTSTSVNRGDAYTRLKGVAIFVDN